MVGLPLEHRSILTPQGSSRLNTYWACITSIITSRRGADQIAGVFYTCLFAYCCSFVNPASQLHTQYAIGYGTPNAVDSLPPPICISPSPVRHHGLRRSRCHRAIGVALHHACILCEPSFAPLPIQQSVTPLTRPPPTQDPNDRVSLLCAYLALLPQALGVVYLTLIFASREVEIALLFAGQLACEALNFVLKRLIKEERPRQIHGKGYGMPSSHAQFVFFWSVALTLVLLVRHRPATSKSKSSAAANKSSRSGSRIVERLAVSAVSLVLAAATAWSRIYLNYHTPRQVLVGSSVGVLSAVAWFVGTALLRRSGLLEQALDLPMARALRVRDLIVEEDLSEAGWDRWEEKRLARKNKLKGVKSQ